MARGGLYQGIEFDVREIEPGRGLSVIRAPDRAIIRGVPLSSREATPASRQSITSVQVKARELVRPVRPRHSHYDVLAALTLIVCSFMVASSSRARFH